ncbi:hypothetical protein HanIR_Chr02g0088411 [Helianthus annuus]|nr:hypothetical protein HanIR_Chr02g0088411 [Helianthus annuus]
MKLECYQQYEGCYSWHLFGYDYPGGYDRDMGGRPGFPDDRRHGRYGGRGYQGGLSDSSRLRRKL